ncbi:hypothetical protein MPER_02919 [Moniliophthora perniciosa FA553]|nr:hypothetical protein MPER_02919 [Moniliophthora perniciosa FA553]
MESDECECNVCLDLELELGCKHPHSCMKRAKGMLDGLPPKWDPREDNPNDYERETKEEEQNEWTYLTPNLTSASNLGDIFRIFTGNSPESDQGPEFVQKNLCQTPESPR